MLNKENCLFQEDIYFFRTPFLIIFTILGVVCIWLILLEPVPTLLLPILLIMVIPLLFGKMAVCLTKNKISVMYGYIKIIKIKVPLSLIKRIDAVSFKGLQHFGGWGIRSGKINGEKTTCLTLKGNRGIFLILTEPKIIALSKINKLLIETQHAQRLLDEIISVNPKIMTGFQRDTTIPDERDSFDEPDNTQLPHV